MPEVTLYSTRTCSLCHAAKSLLDRAGATVREVSLEDQPELRDQLSARLDGWRTVPMIFVGERFIGGFQDLVKLEREGKLAEMLSNPEAS